MAAINRFQVTHHASAQIAGRNNSIISRRRRHKAAVPLFCNAEFGIVFEQIKLLLSSSVLLVASDD
jgi:hypothetical protein